MTAPPSRFSLTLSALALLVAAVIVGIVTRQPILQSFLPGKIGMKSVTAALFVTVIIGLIAERRNARRTGAAAGLAIFAFGGLALAEYLLDADFGTGRIFGRDHSLILTPIPGRMAPATSVAFIAIGLVFMLFPLRHSIAVLIRRLLTALVLLIGLTVVVGYLYGAREFVETGAASPVALPTALALMLAALAVRSVKDGVEWPWSLWQGNGVTANLSRFLIPIILLIPVVAGFVRLYGERSGWFGWELGTALIVLFHILVLMSVLLWTLTRLHENEQLEKAHEGVIHQRSVELQQANRELEGFSYSVSHDLRAPLRAIDGYSRMLEEDCEAVFDADGKRYLSVVRSETRRMAALIDDLLAFSQIGRSSLAHVPLDLAGMAREIVDELQRSHPDRPIELHLAEMPMAWGDRSTIRQVLVNFLGNAVKYSGTKNLMAIRIEMSAETKGDENVYSIRDYGVGFDMRYVGKLFGVFQRLHSAEEFEGTGVGLAIVERVVSRHGGRVWAEGRLGEGSTFSFSLPSQTDDLQQSRISKGTPAETPSIFDRGSIRV